MSRSLTSVSSALSAPIVPQLTLEIEATDTSTTYIYQTADIKQLKGPSWEVPFGGGLGKMSRFNVELFNDIDTLKERLPGLKQAKTTLKFKLTVIHSYHILGVSEKSKGTWISWASLN